MLTLAIIALVCTAIFVFLAVTKFDPTINKALKQVANRVANAYIMARTSGKNIKADYLFDVPRSFVEYCIEHAPTEEQRKELQKRLDAADKEERIRSFKNPKPG